MSSLFKTSWMGQIFDTFGQWFKLITAQTFFSLDSLEFCRRKLSSYPLTKSLYLLLRQAVLFTNLNANVNPVMWVELIRD